MKRFHVHVSVADLSASIRYYSALFAAEPTVLKPDYAKWALDDPSVNFAISRRGAAQDRLGVDHLGIQVETDEELADMRTRLANADLPMQAQIGTNCCYANSDKYWSVDPQGVAWESFHTLASVPTYGEARQSAGEGTACCAPASQAIPMPRPTNDPACCGPRSSCC
ncbi:ArsI/CadI family heavy metal resistance metalloenzyme [Cupriavidus respiraculi]|uniref:Cadmium-induced protein CadI n=1 Tax=Cupriavidus respiraculi TaxID=195930 RepID=A0ABM8X552_9BURK|nr:ArsI/CadI family heavy metal resistance metalloenzyme [Cupriavidus respiraculi]CAG9175040.1 Cadmium-induced protein CadI [Cupriavidus respiraculi]